MAEKEPEQLRKELEDTRNQIEKLKRENDSLKRRLDSIHHLSAYSDISIALNSDGRILAVIGGKYTRKEENLKGKHLAGLADPEYRGTVDSFIHSSKKEGLFPVKFDGLFQSGKRWLELRDKSAGAAKPAWKEDANLLLHFRDITETKKTLKKLKKSRERQWQIVDLLPNMVYARDGDGRFVFANEATARLYETEPKQLVGKKGGEFSLTGLRATFLDEDLEVLKSGEPKSTTEVLPGKEGNERIMKTRRIPYNMIDKNERAVLVATTDITEREKTKEALNRERLKLKQLHGTVDQLKRQDSKGNLLQTAVNVAEKILDFEICAVGLVEGNYLVTKALSTGLAEDETIRFKIGEGIAGKTVEEGETIWGKDVSDFPEAQPTNEEFKAFISVPIGELGNFQVISKEYDNFDERDVKLAEILAGHIESELLRLNYEEELVKTKDALEKSREKYKRLVESQGEGIISTDLDTNVVFANPAAARTFGAEEPEEVIDKKITDYLSQDQTELMEEEMKKRTEGEVSTYEIEYTKPGTDEKIIILVTAKPRRDDEDNIIGSFAIFRDITERVKAERELKELNERMREMTQMVAHEVRTPLTTIRGYADMMVDGVTGKISDEQEEMLSEISKSSQRLSTLVKDFLDLEKMDAGQLEMDTTQVNLKKLLEDTVEQYEKQAKKKGLKPHSSFDEDLPVMGDRQKLSRVFSNLVSNAIKYTKSGNITVRGERKEDLVKITVKDEGVGIAKNELDQIFDKFYRAESSKNSSANGSGLGLTFVRKVIEAHDGSIEVDSQLNEGTEFSVYLPLSNVDR